MKKLKAFLAMMISALALISLASCGKKAKLEVVNISCQRTKIGVTILIDDPKSYITLGSVVATLYETEGDEDKVSTLTFDSLKEEEQTKTFKDLEKNTTYKLVIKATVDDKSKTFYNKKVTTSDEGESWENPIKISTAAELLDMTYDNEAYYKLTAPIDFTKEDGTKTVIDPMFDESKSFEGHFDGQGNEIKGFSLTKSTAYVGLFGYVAMGAEVKNLNISDASIDTSKSSNYYCGSLAACNQGTIMNCSAKNIEINHAGTSTSKAFIGGLVGVNSGILKDSCVEGVKMTTRTRCENFVGGLVGINGGVIQGATEECLIDNCHATDVVIENTFASVTKTDKDTSSNAYFFSYVGGLVGETRNTISNSYASSTIKSTTSIIAGSILNSYEIALGGFAGRATAYSYLKGCASVVTFDASSADAYKQYVGAFVGEMSDSKASDVCAIIKGENAVRYTADYTGETYYSQIEKVCDTPKFGFVGKTSATFLIDVVSIDNYSYYNNATYKADGYVKANVTSATFADLKAKLFTLSGDTYTALASDAEYDSTAEYYQYEGGYLSDTASSTGDLSVLSDAVKAFVNANI